MFEKQGQHYILLIVLLAGVYFLATGDVLVAAFNHLYIWVQFYSTELPDSRHIYGSQTKESA